ncbi:MAG TPA: SDR family oxidoreductase [Oligoflexia bacterium]|nr:SDR family oxidoreductase [Oligoflexia bacterium]HMR23810.1 SDR family oxidoreductase [Oligoflexia bacterium]
MKHIVITGAAGFLGVNLVKRLLKENDTHITCLDNFFSAYSKNIEWLQSQQNIKLIEHDIRTAFHSSEKVDEIYNLACPASPPVYQSDPIFTTETSVLGAINMLNLAHQHDATILQASTSEIYGDPTTHPQTESYRGNVNPVGIRSCYDEGKRCAESLFFDHHRMHGTKIKVIRIFNTYGPHMNPEDGRVVSNFIVQALKGNDLTVYGDGQQTRSFCYVEDLIAGMIAVMKSPKSLQGPYNLGNDTEYTVEQLAKIIIEKINPKLKLIKLPLPKDDPYKRKPCLQKVKKDIAWQPNVSLDQGLDTTINFFKTNI